MKNLIFSFEAFIDGSFDLDPVTGEHASLWLRCEKDVGGRITKKEIDKLKDRREIDVVTISGLRQDTFEYFIKTYGKQFRAIRFFKNRFVQDWSLLAELSDVEYLDLFMNHCMTALWDVGRNKSLTGLRIMDFSKLTSIDGIASAPALRAFMIGNAARERMKLDSLMPLAGSGVEKLVFTGKDVLDKDLSFLADMPRLKVFDFPSNLYLTEQVAWISANFPSLTGYAIRPYIEFAEKVLGGADRPPDHLIIGKSKPFLQLPGHEQRLRSYAEAFEAMKKRCAGKSYAEVFSQTKQKKKRTGKKAGKKKTRARKLPLRRKKKENKE